MPKKGKRKYYRINQYIKAREVRLIDKTGKQVGILRLEEALKKAEEEGLDLVEVAPQANPPVCRILNFREWLYKNKVKKKRKPEAELKEIRLRPFVSPHDLEVKLKRARAFLKEKNSVRVTIQFRGREMRHREKGKELFAKIQNELSKEGKVVLAPKFKGRMLVGIFGPK